MRRDRAIRKQMQNLHAFRLAVEGELMPQGDFLSGLVTARVKGVISALVGPLNVPAGKDLRHLGDVALRVSAVDAEGVEFHQLARVVFIESHRTRFSGLAVHAHLGTPRGEGMRTDALGLVEIEEHGGALRGCDEKVFKFAHRMRTDDLVLVVRQIPGREFALAQIHVEVVQPEVGHHRFELALAVDVAQHARDEQFATHNELRVDHREDSFFLLRRQVREQRDAFGPLQTLEEIAELVGLHLD